MAALSQAQRRRSRPAAARAPPLRKPKATAPTPDAEAVAHAREAGLRYVSDAKPGITRKRAGKGFRYLGPDGKPVRDKDTLARIRSLAIPPAWSDVWISPSENGHLQATGRDEKGRKQYRYHEGWRAVRDGTKYDRMLAFGRVLPRLRRHVQADLRRPGMPREKVLATLVRLMDMTCIRVGNEEYAQKNGSYGLTTFRNRHAKVRGGTVQFKFLGKSGKSHDIDVDDPHLARIVRRCQSIPGQELFQYVDEEGEPQSVDSADVNDYLRDIAGEEFTAKDFRTWAGTVSAALTLLACEPYGSETEAKQNVTKAIEEVSRQLGNTPAVCRKAYVHPAVLDAYLDGSFQVSMEGCTATATLRGKTTLSAGEKAVLKLLKARSRAAKRAA